MVIMNKLFVVFCFVFLICSCQMKNSYHPSEKEHLANVVTKKVAKQLKMEEPIPAFTQLVPDAGHPQPA